VSWTGNTEADLAGYRLYVGTSSGVYGQPIQVSKSATNYVVTGLPKGQTYFIAVSAYDTTGNESQKSAEVSKSLF
jgi:fibronectin type 3 domain-containing protein